MTEPTAWPRRSFTRYFSRLGRLENAWAAALAEADSWRALEQLRKVARRFEKSGANANVAACWLPFQQSMLDRRVAALLTESDFELLQGLGVRMAASGVGIHESWWPLAQTLFARARSGDRQRACVLLTGLYGSPLVPETARVQAAAALAGSGAVGDAELAVYADLLARQPWPPPEVAALVDSVLQVGFADDDARLGRALTLAELFGTRVAHPSAAYALGLGELLLRRRPEAAAWYFQQAFHSAANRGEDVQHGLLAAYLHARDYHSAIAAGLALSPRGAELVALCRMLAWLDCAGNVQPGPAPGEPVTEGPPLATTDLTAILPGRDTGLWRDYALGRSYLLEGDAEQAKRYLAPLPAASFGSGVGPTEADVHYHMAWARLLCQDAEGVRAAYAAVAGRTGSWALSCLCQDADLGRAPSQGAAPLIPPPLERFAAARSRLDDGSCAPAVLDWDVSAFGNQVSQADQFEALRTALGVAAACEDIPALETLSRQPLFARLPIAERLLWNGLAVRRSDPGRSCALLERARGYGRDRASLLLALDALEAGQTHRVRVLLRDVHGPKAELLQAWADGRDGAVADASARFEQLAEAGLLQAGRALGVLELISAAQEWSRGKAGEAQEHGRRAVLRLMNAAPHNESDALLIQAAQAFDERTVYTLPWRDAATHPWIARLLGLAQLLRTPEAADAELIRALELWEYIDGKDRGGPGTAGGIALAEALLRACALADDAAVSGQASALLERLADRVPAPETRRAAQRAAALTAFRANGDYRDRDTDPMLALVGAGAALANGNREQAVRRLRAVQQEDESDDRVGMIAVLADALDGGRLPHPLPVDLPPSIASALEVVGAAGRLAAGETAQAAVVLAGALGAQEANDLIEMRLALPWLCARAVERGRRGVLGPSLAPVVRRVAAEQDIGGLDPRMLARCAVVAGEFEVADALWRRALEADDADGQLAEEYRWFLRHRAAVEDPDRDRAAVLSRLRAAVDAGSDSERRLLQDMQTDDMIDMLLSHLFPDSPMLAMQRPGRYPALVKMIAASPGLHAALGADIHEKIIHEWVCETRQATSDVELWHTVAVLCREDALARPAGSLEAAQALVTATAMWTLLLSDPAFPALLGTNQPPERAAARVTACRELVEDLLAGHKAQLTQRMADNETELAGIHVRCLKSVGEGIVAARGLMVGTAFEALAERIGREAEYAPIAGRAADLIEAWAVDRVAVAERLLSDPAAIRNLPHGIDRDYRSALVEMWNVVRVLGIERRSVLVQALEWHNLWLHRLYKMTERDMMRDVLKSAAEFAGPLASQCTPGVSYLPENQSLGKYYMFQGYLAIRDEPAEAVELLGLALAWNPDETSAPGLIETAKVVLQKKEEDAKAVLCRRLLDGGDIAGAVNAAGNSPGLRRYLAAELNGRGVMKSNQAVAVLNQRRPGTPISALLPRVRPALQEADRLLAASVRVAPDNPVSQQNLRQVRELERRLSIL
jgi:hypothetical protein